MRWLFPIGLLILMFGCKKDPSTSNEHVFFEPFDSIGEWQLIDQTCQNISSSATINNGELSLNASNICPCSVYSSATLDIASDQLPTSKLCSLSIEVDVTSYFMSPSAGSFFDIDYMGFHLRSQIRSGLIRWELSSNQLTMYFDNVMAKSYDEYNKSFWIDDELSSRIYIEMHAGGADCYHIGNLSINSIKITSSAGCSPNIACFCPIDTVYWQLTPQDKAWFDFFDSTLVYEDSSANEITYQLEYYDTIQSTFSRKNDCLECELSGPRTVLGERIETKYNEITSTYPSVNIDLRFLNYNSELMISHYLSSFAHGPITTNPPPNPDISSLTIHGKTFTDLYYNEDNGDAYYFSKKDGLCIIFLDNVYWSIK